jgi:hypothetical protein
VLQRKHACQRIKNNFIRKRKHRSAKQKQEYAIKRPSSPDERRIMSFGDEHHPKMTKIQAENLAILVEKVGRKAAST